MSQSSTAKKVPPLKQVHPSAHSDDDLEQIVTEIGELEHDMDITAQNPGAVQAQVSDESLIQGLDELAEDTGGAPKVSLLDDPAPRVVASAGAAAEGSLNLVVRGGTQVSLQVEVGGRTATVSFKDGVLRVETADGAEFKIPLAS